MADRVSEALSGIQSGQLVFLAGSGVSYASGVPSAAMVLEQTMKRYLPNVLPELSSEVLIGELATVGLAQAFQPEIFYEQLLLIAPVECLNAWAILRHPFPPNLNHLFLVAYAHASRTPLVTTNFDLLFERAAKQLGLKPVIYVPGDQPARLTPHLAADEFSLWKVHGTIADDPDRGTVKDQAEAQTAAPSILTTMESISRINPSMLSALRSVIRGKLLCFVGYSASDVDLFPEIRAFRPRLLWIDRNLAGGKNMSAPVLNMRRRLRQLNGQDIELWPDELFAKYLERYGSLPNGAQIDLGAVRDQIRAFLDRFDQSKRFEEVLANQPGPQWDTEQEGLLEVLLLKARGRYVAALKRADPLQRDIGGTQRHPELIGLATLAAAQLAHERSRYVDCEMTARGGLETLAMIPRAELRPFRTLFGCLVAEARRMQFAHDVHYKLRLPLSLSFGVCALFALVLQSVRLLAESLTEQIRSLRLPHGRASRHRQPWPSPSRMEIVQLYAQFEAIEHSIRLIAFLRALLERAAHGRRALWRPGGWLLKAMLMRVDRRCKRLGYAAGAANLRKFLARLQTVDTVEIQRTIEEGVDLYTIGHYATGIELSARNLGDYHLGIGDVSKAEEAYHEMLEGARASGNQLNGVKALVGTGFCRPLSIEEFDELRSMCEGVQGEDWQRLLALVLKLFDPSTSARGRWNS